MYQVNVDFAGPNGPQGNVAGALHNQGTLNPGRMRPVLGRDGRSYVTVYVGGDPLKKESYRAQPIQTNATLRRDEWKQLDDAVQKAATIRLTGVQDLVDNNLVLNLGNGMGTTVLEWHSRSQAHQAVLTMDGITRGQNDQVDYKHNYMPVPILHVDFEINARFLEASRRMGTPADVTEAEEAARAIALLREQMLFTNLTYAYGEKDSNTRNSIYSYVNFPDRNQVTMGTAWTAETAANILADVISMKQASIDALHFGPWMLYIPVGYETVMDKDFDSTTATGRTIRERLMQIDGINAIKVIDTLAADNVLLVEMNTSTVRLVRGLPLQSIQWKEEGNFITKFKVVTIDIPQIRSDYNGRCGIVQLANSFA